MRRTLTIDVYFYDAASIFDIRQAAASTRIDHMRDTDDKMQYSAVSYATSKQEHISFEGALSS